MTLTIYARRVWYAVGGRRHYKGPQSNRTDLNEATAANVLVAPAYGEKVSDAHAA